MVKILTDDQLRLRIHELRSEIDKQHTMLLGIDGRYLMPQQASDAEASLKANNEELAWLEQGLAVREYIVAEDHRREGERLFHLFKGKFTHLADLESGARQVLQDVIQQRAILAEHVKVAMREHPERLAEILRQ